MMEFPTSLMAVYPAMSGNGTLCFRSTRALPGISFSHQATKGPQVIETDVSGKACCRGCFDQLTRSDWCIIAIIGVGKKRASCSDQPEERWLIEESREWAHCVTRTLATTSEHQRYTRTDPHSKRSMSPQWPFANALAVPTYTSHLSA